jgi:ferredoxin
MAPVQFQMSKKDGKSVLIHSQNAKGFFTLKSHDHTIVESCELAAKACPVKIITIKET